MADKLLGSFVWTELMTTDPAAAASFYKKVVGWTTTAFGPDGSYTVLNNSSGGGRGGIMALPDQAKQMGVPPNWMMYVGTPNVDETAMRVAQLGGRVHKQPEDIPTVGRFAVVQDPFGATFAIFTPANPGADMGKAGTGDFSWFELYTPNPDGAWKFYETLFGWEKTSAMDMGPEMGTYQMFGRGGGIPNGGIMKPPPGAPAAWMPYALVKDAKAAAAAATANGGKIVNGPMEVPGGDWIAQGIDPQGAMFAVHSLNPAAQKAAETKEKVKRVVKKVAKAVAAVAAVGVAARTAKARLAKKATAKKAAAKKAAPKTAGKKAARKTAKKTKPIKKSTKQPSKKTARKAAKKSAKKAAKRKK